MKSQPTELLCIKVSTQKMEHISILAKLTNYPHTYELNIRVELSHPALQILILETSELNIWSLNSRLAISHILTVIGN